MLDLDERASAAIDDLPDSAFAYIEPGGTKDSSGKTTPRDLRHFPIHDANHVRNALARMNQSPYGEKARPAIMAAAKKFGIDSAMNADAAPVEARGRLDKEERGFNEFESRQADDGTWTVGGYASTFNDPYTVRDRYGEFSETILTGAWERTLNERGHKIQLLDSHGGLPHGSTKAGNLRLSTDTHGLEWEWTVTPDMPTRSKDVAIGIHKGIIDEMSVGMRIPAGGDNWDGDERTIHEASLLEISVVARGANPNTEAAPRSLAEQFAEMRAELRAEWEQFVQPAEIMREQIRAELEAELAAVELLKRKKELARRMHGF